MLKQKKIDWIFPGIFEVSTMATREQQLTFIVFRDQGREDSGSRSEKDLINTIGNSVLLKLRDLKKPSCLLKDLFQKKIYYHFLA